MSRPALIDKLMQAGKWLLKPELIPLSNLVKTGGGLAVDTETGKLYVDFSLVPDDQMQAIVLAMVQTGGGLAVDKTGKLYVDFASMPTDKFEAMLKSIRVPIWLTKNMIIYVATTGSDTLDEGRGLTEDKPFATLQAALNYVSDTYNLSRYNLTIRLAEGDYGDASIQLPDYTTSSGRITIQGATADAEDVIVGRISINTPVEYYVDHLTIKAASPVQGALYVCDCQNGTINLRNIIFDLRNCEPLPSQPYRALCSRGGTIRIPSTNADTPTGIKILPHPTRAFTPLYATVGTISFIADITVDGDMTVSEGFAYATNGGTIQRGWYGDTNPGRLPVVSSTGSVTGRRYTASMNGVIYTYNGGAEFFPGSESGVLSTGGQYS